MGQIVEQIRKKNIGLTSYQLKWIAIITMMIDHIGAVLFPEELMFRYIGRLAFPIFCFLLVEGVYYTHDIRLYMLRLGMFAVISEVPYDLAFHGTALEFEGQNVFFTLLLGVMLLYLLERDDEWPIKIMEVLLAMWVAGVLRTDYGYKGILLISIFYFFHRHRLAGLAIGALWNYLWYNRTQEYGALAMIPLALYNGERGRRMKYFFYVFYPLHLVILFAISRMIAR